MFCQWSERRILWKLVILYFLFLELTSIAWSDFSQCMVSKIDEACPSLHEFLFSKVGTLLDRFLAHDFSTIFGALLILFMSWELTAWFYRKRLDQHDNKHIHLPSFFRLNSVDKFTFLLVIVGIFQWLTLEKTDETLKSQQRAWIEPRAPSITSGRVKGESLSYTIRYANIGNEPAVNVVIQTDVRPVDVATAGDQARGWFPRKNDICKHSHPNDAGLVIWQSDSKTHELFYTSSDPPRDAEDVWNGLKFLVLEGCIGYETVGSAHYSAFCYYTRPTAQKPPNEWPLQLCMNHNTAD